MMTYQYDLLIKAGIIDRNARIVVNRQLGVTLPQLAQDNNISITRIGQIMKSTKRVMDRKERLAKNPLPMYRG